MKESECNARERNQIQKGAAKCYGRHSLVGSRQQWNPGPGRDAELGGIPSGLGCFSQHHTELVLTASFWPVDTSLISKTGHYNLDFEMEGCLSVKRWHLSSLAAAAGGNGSCALQPRSATDAQVTSRSVALLNPLATLSFCTTESSSSVENTTVAGHFERT